MFTASCLWPVLTTYGLVGLLFALRFRAWRARIVFAVLLMLVSWQTSDFLKDVFARPRPAYWIVHHETTFAYSSGHAMFATIVYWLWAYHCARSSAPRALRIPLAAALSAWGAGVVWSRLALGAHYPSDLIGGILLGIVMISLGILVARIVAPQARVI
jgi:undecaprenyl-diphosphatase